MIIVAASLLVLLTVPLAGGRFEHLVEVKLRDVWSIVAAFGLQVAIVNVFGAVLSPEVAEGLHLASYALAGWFVLRNLRVPGVVILFVGGAMNLVAIAANGGVMPASPAAVRSAGLQHAVGEFENSRPNEDARLAFLGDVFAVPDGVPFANVFSPGDVLLVFGLAVAVHAGSGSRLQWRGRRRSTMATDDTAVEAAVDVELAVAPVVVAMFCPMHGTSTDRRARRSLSTRGLRDLQEQAGP